MDYTEIAVWVPVGYAETLAWHLQELGAQGVVVSEISAKGPVPEEVAVKTYRLGGVEEQASWIAELRTRLEALRKFLGGASLRVETRLTPEEDWAHSWKQYWHPQAIGERFVIKPSWEAVENADDKLVIELDPKQAFGTGTHPTTQLCLRGLEAIVPKHAQPLVFDIGTGSGILAIGAILLGARHVEACDTDPVATAATDENAELNRVADRVVCHTGGIETISGVSDILVVNILAEVVAELAPEIASRVRPGGDVLASGIIREREVLVKDAFAAAGLVVDGVEYQGEWVLVTAHKPA